MSDEVVKAIRTGRLADLPQHFTHRARAEEYLLIWVIGGHGVVATEGRHIKASAGSLLTFRKGLEHSYGSDREQPWSILWVHFDGPAAAGIVAELRDGRSDPARSLGLDRLLHERFLELIATHRAATPAHRRLADRLLWALLGLIAHRLALPPPARPHADPVAALQHYVQEHLATPLTVEALARVANLSPRHLSRLMQQTLGCAPMQYVIDQRMDHAATLLRESALPVKQVAAVVGYDDPFHFARSFRARTGESPTSYRQRHGGARSRIG